MDDKEKGARERRTRNGAERECEVESKLNGPETVGLGKRECEHLNTRGDRKNEHGAEARNKPARGPQESQQQAAPEQQRPCCAAVAVLPALAKPLKQWRSDWWQRTVEMRWQLDGQKAESRCDTECGALRSQPCAKRSERPPHVGDESSCGRLGHVSGLWKFGRPSTRRLTAYEFSGAARANARVASAATRG